ncbi:MAG: hypothetical protein ACI97K_003393, partial [Glaciecola sp.]
YNLKQESVNCFYMNFLIHTLDITNESES